MASKFQNRLMGTVILVALGVILLPSLLDGNKQSYQDEFAAIPLVPKPGDPQEIDVIAPLNQSLPAIPPAGVDRGTQDRGKQGSEAQNGDAAVTTTPQRPADNQSSSADHTVPPVTILQPAPIRGNKTRPETVTPAPMENRTTTEAKPHPEAKPQTEPKPAEAKPPVGEAYIVQLGALKNADKANEIIATLRLSGYRAYTIPAKPVSGQLTRIVVGPDASQQKLQSLLPELNRLSGLNGQVRPYTPNRGGQ